MRLLDVATSVAATIVLMWEGCVVETDGVIYLRLMSYSLGMRLVAR